MYKHILLVLDFDIDDEYDLGSSHFRPTRRQELDISPWGENDHSLFDFSDVGSELDSMMSGSSYSSNYYMSYTYGGGSEPVFCEKTSTTRKMGDISETHYTSKDSTTGTESLTIKRSLGNRSVTLIRSRDLDGREYFDEKLENVPDGFGLCLHLLTNAGDAAAFDREWRAAVEALHNPSTTATRGLHTSSSRRLALPQPAPTSTRPPASTQTSSRTTQIPVIKPSRIEHPRSSPSKSLASRR